MKKILLLLSISLIFSCSTARKIFEEGTYKCYVYSYTYIFTELREKDRYVERVMHFENQRLIFEEEFVKSGELAGSKTYSYNNEGLLDTIFWFYQDVNLPIVHNYKEGQLFEVYDLYRGKVQMRQKHFYTDTSHTIQNFIGGLFSNTMYVYYNDSGSKIKEEYYSPQGEFWGMDEYHYTEFGKVSIHESRNRSNELMEITSYTYDKDQNLSWVIIKDEKGKLIKKLKYEYAK